VSNVYTTQVAVRHDELDRFARAHPGVYLRYLAHAAVEASTAAGYDATWYARAGALWLIRRSTLDVVHPATLGERLTIRTWVEDFRRVRSHRRYEVYGTGGALCLSARTDWVYVDAATFRPRRVPAEFEAGFGVASGTGPERDAWQAPPPPPAPAVLRHRVRASEVDSVGHVNNAVYLDLAGQAVLDALADVGWALDRLLERGAVPVLARADLEYLGGARYGDPLVIHTWFAPAADALEAHQHVLRDGETRPLVRAATRWRWTDPAVGVAGDPPPGMWAALRPLVAA